MFGDLALVSVSANSKFSNAMPLANTTKKREIGQSNKLESMAGITRNTGQWNRDSIQVHDSGMLAILRADLDSVGAGSSVY